jgi:SAM-dependent methyltransferase
MAALQDSGAARDRPTGLDTMSSGLLSAKNYHAWTSSWIRPFIRGRVLDVGGGTGNHLQELTTHELVSIDCSRECVDWLRQRYRSERNFRFVHGDIARAETVAALGDASFDTVVSSNVFEHIEDDRAAFRNCARLLKPGGALVLVLPAHAQLMGSMDHLAGHFRRYDRPMVRERFADAGLAAEQLRYVNLFGAIGWYVNNRLIQHRRLSSQPINLQIRLFDALVVPLMRAIEGTRSMPFGQTLVAVGRKATG